MATTLSASVRLAIAASLSESLDIGSKSFSASKNYNQSFTDGSGADQATIVWTDTRTVSALSEDNLDLAGVLTNAFGSSISFASLKAIVIKAAAANPGDLYVGGDDAAQVTTLFTASDSQLVLKAGGTFIVTAPAATGYEVTATTADILTIENPHATLSCTYDIILIGD